MTTSTLTAAMPALELTEGESLVLEAIDPTTGAAVAGVVANNFVIYAKDARDDDPGEVTPESVYLLSTESAGRDPADFGGPGGG